MSYAILKSVQFNGC